MSMPPVMKLFEAGLIGANPLATSVDSVIQISLENAIREADAEAGRYPQVKQEADSHPFLQCAQLSSDPDDLLHGLKEYLSRTAMIMHHLAENLVKGPHIDALARELHQMAHRKTSLSDITRISTRDVQLSEIRKIRDISAQYSRDVQDICRPKTPGPRPSPKMVPVPYASIPPMSGVPRSGLVADEDDARALKTRKVRQDSAMSPVDDMSDSGASSGETFDIPDMPSLRQRGKGAHSCPKGLRCTKGGVDKDGKIVVFDRNSAFVQHCNKHQKPYQCELPGCPNPVKKRKFARRDGLERHMRTVKHAVGAT